MPVLINEKEYKLEKLTLDKWHKIFQSIETLPSLLANLDDKLSLIEALPLIINKSYDELIDVLNVATGINKGVLKMKCGLLELAQIIEEVLEVNGYAEVKKIFGKLLQRKQG